MGWGGKGIWGEYWEERREGTLQLGYKINNNNKFFTHDLRFKRGTSG